ncbi:MAG: FIST N-terminal domain-containing protein [Alphaproteobacteria bacterium]
MSDAPFLAAHALDADWRQAARALAHGLRGAGPDHRLGILYVSDAHADALGDVRDLLRAETGVPDWIGTVGLGVCGGTQEYFDAPAMAAMALPVPQDAFRLFADIEDATAVAGADRPWLRDAPPLVILHADPRTPRLGALVQAMAEATDGFLVGGLTASRGAQPQLAGRLSDGGVSGALLALDRVPALTALTQGCTPLGPVHRVTAAEDNLLIEIDGRPALDVFKQDIGELLARDLRRVAGYIFAGLPVQGSDTGDYLVRNLVAIDPEHGLIAIADDVAAGDPILFCRRDGASAVADMQRMLDDLHRRAGDRPVRGALYVSCCARGPNQFGPDSREVGLIRERFGDVPLVGFFANGEISRDRIYGYTGVLTLFL